MQPACSQHPHHVRRSEKQSLGTALGVSRQTINAIETERYTPSLPLALSMAKFFKVSVEEMFHANKGPENDQ
ncbi:helix-turn-helix transcriptional regulator [Streptomyces sp. NPDC101150]|uniref:helix-turn-helix transcriptional regulator n=1 Tax=Streptomyces sp. NPDC101150 TaxID=3366114 RepID=UPI00381275FA